MSDLCVCIRDVTLKFNLRDHMHLVIRCYLCVLYYVLCVREVICSVYICWWLNDRKSRLSVYSELCVLL